MADKQPAPQAHEEQTQPGSIWEAQEAILKIEESERETPETEEATPTEEEESQPIAEDESLEEETEEEEEADEAEEESEEPDEEDEEELLYAVKVDGEEQEVTLDELMKGYSRQSDYTKKTQELSEGRKAIEQLYGQYNSEINAVQQERQQYISALSQVIEHSVAGLDAYQNIDWETLKNEDPIDYLTKKEEQSAMQNQVAYNMQQRDQVALAQKQQQAQRREHFRLSEQHRLVEVLPEWSDADTRTQLTNDMREYAINNGFTEQDLSGLIDHRYFLTLMKAQKYDALQKSDVKAKKVKNKPKVVRAGSPRGKKATDKKQRTVKMKRLQNTGHVDDAASILEDMFNS